MEREARNKRDEHTDGANGFFEAAARSVFFECVNIL